MKVRSSYGHHGKKNPMLMADATAHFLPLSKPPAPVLSNLLKAKFP